MSHTVKFQSQYKNAEALGRAVVARGGEVLGFGSHHLSSTTEVGFGFRLPGWKKPLVAKDDGSLAMDPFNGIWGDVADLKPLEEEYIIQTAMLYCEQRGLSTERLASGELLVYYPSGGAVTVSPKGLVDANGFHGSACSEATRPLLEALGIAGQEERKDCYIERQLEIPNE